MRFNCLTLFPQMFTGFMGESMAARAIEAGLIDIRCYDIRAYSKDRHRRADDYPFGGGAGLVMMPQPLFDCFEAVQKELEGQRCTNVYMTPKGRPLTMKTAKELLAYDALNILCGHYEGVDQRVLDRYIDREVSIGDYVLTGGELPAMVLVDCVMRMIPGVLGNALSGEDESFSDGLLEYPQYTRPAEYGGEGVPEILLNGHHEHIRRWRRRMSLLETLRKRPELIETARLSREDEEILAGLKDEGLI